MQSPVYVQGAPQTVVVVEQPSANSMDRSNYAGDFTYTRGKFDVTYCGRQEIPGSEEKFTVCCMVKQQDAMCFEQEHPDLVIKKMDIGEISPMPTQDETTTCCYCCCQECACIMPNHDLYINDGACLCMHSRGECNIGEAEACCKGSKNIAECDFQRTKNCVIYSEQQRFDLLCCTQCKTDDSCDGTCHTCCKGQVKCLCCVRKFALPTDDDVPFGIGCLGVMCCGGQAKQPEQPQGNTVVVVQN
jgi:hypothetical protein